MKDEIRQRIQAVQRFLAGEKPESICVSMGLSRSWLYKWISRYDEKDSSWCENRPTVCSMQQIGRRLRLKRSSR